MAKARPVSGLRPRATLLDNARAIVAVRVAEMFDFAHAVGDLAEDEDLHNMRIAAKRLRYTLEMFQVCLGPDGPELIEAVKEIQERIGSIHDANVPGRAGAAAPRRGRPPRRRGAWRCCRRRRRGGAGRGCPRRRGGRRSAPGSGRAAGAHGGAARARVRRLHGLVGGARRRPAARPPRRRPARQRRRSSHVRLTVLAPLGDARVGVSATAPTIWWVVTERLRAYDISTRST